MRVRYRRSAPGGSAPGGSAAVRVTAVVASLAAAGVLTATFVSSGGRGTADAATDLGQYVPIQQIKPNVVTPRLQPGASTGRFTVDCGTNGIGKFSPDNPVAQPGIKNGAEHLHDFVGNLAITATTSDADLDRAGTTCKNGDKSSYFWPVVRIDRTVRSASAIQAALADTSATVVCPSIRDRLPAVPTGAVSTVERQLIAVEQAEAAADRRILAVRGVNPALNNAILRGLRSGRMAALAAIGDAIRAHGGRRPAGMVSLADCDVNYDAVHAAVHGSHPATTTPGAASPAANPTVQCPSARNRLPGVPPQALDEVDRDLDELDRQISEANQRLVTTRGQGGPDFVDNAILGPLRAERTAVLDRIGIAIGRHAARPQGLGRLAACGLDRNGGAASPAPSSAPSPAPSSLPGPQGRDLELPGNTGRILRPAKVLIEYRGNATGKVVPMPKFLRELTGDAKPTSRGPANARATWTCSGFADRLSTDYPICPAGSLVQRVQDFPGCWDGRNLDSANHRDQVAFADRRTGACPAGFVAIPQLRITLSYAVPRDVQLRGQFALDSFPEENHNPFSDHNDFVNVNSAQTMQRIAACINKGRNCS